MSNNTFNPKSRQEDERLIVRDQSNFTDGLFLDLPASNISDNSLAELKNFVNMGDALIGRGGTKQWSNTKIPDKVSSVAVSWTISNTSRTITASSGTPFTFDDIGNWVVFADGTIEKIVTYTSDTVIVTTTSSSGSGSGNIDIRGHLNAVYFHKENKKVLIHVDNRIFMAEEDNMINWTECIRNSIVKPSNNTSRFEEFENYVVLFNSNGIFKCNIDQSPPIYFRCNIPVPNTKITSSGYKADATPYGYKYVYSLSRMPGFGFRTRKTPGVKVELETGTNVVDDNFQDYGATWQSSRVGSGAPITISTLTNSLDPIDPTKINQEATHYSIYRTLDIGDNGTDPLTGNGNNPELYVWVDDVPVAKAFTVTVSGTTCTSTVGYFENVDIGTTINIYDGTNEYERTISARPSGTVVTLSSELPSGATTQPAAIGAPTLLSLSQSESFVTNEDVGLYQFTSGDVGKTLYWADGGYSVVSGFTSASGVGVHDSETRASQGACMDPTARTYRDIIIDDPEDESVPFNVDQLRVRIAGNTLQQRFWTALSNGNIGQIVPGFMFVAPRNSKYLYYQQMPEGYEYLMGYHNAAYQTTRFKDPINNLVEYPNSLVVRCKSSTHDVPINTWSEVTIPEVGEFVAVLSSQNVVDENIGSNDFGGSVWTDEGVEIVITQEPAIRVFNGQKYSENIATDRIMGELRKMNPAYASSYDPINGFIFWGSNG